MTTVSKRVWCACICPRCRKKYAEAFLEPSMLDESNGRKVLHCFACFVYMERHTNMRHAKNIEGSTQSV